MTNSKITYPHHLQLGYLIHAKESYVLALIQMCPESPAPLTLKNDELIHKAGRNIAKFTIAEFLNFDI